MKRSYNRLQKLRESLHKNTVRDLGSARARLRDCEAESEALAAGASKSQNVVRSSELMLYADAAEVSRSHAVTLKQRVIERMEEEVKQRVRKKQIDTLVDRQKVADRREEARREQSVSDDWTHGRRSR